MNDRNKFIGSILILIGTVIGAGILALPIVCAGMGFVRASIALIVVCAIMLITGLLTLEVNLAFKPYRNHLGTMAEATLGQYGKIVSWIVTILLLYALTSAYISGNSSLLGSNLERFTSIRLPDYSSKFLVTMALGSIVCWSTNVVDIFNRSFLSVKG
ncbi:MAG: tyrosine-specific transport protein, partial [Gammaproteobacteria bacterium]|nr:tyrosine-specific transport protein [Gammaproteobacteria bacterium]